MGSQSGGADGVDGRGGLVNVLGKEGGEVADGGCRTSGVVGGTA